MPKITFISADGTERAVDIDNGLSLMEGAVQNLVRGSMATAAVPRLAAPHSRDVL